MKSDSVNIFVSYATNDKEVFRLKDIVQKLENIPEISSVFYWERDNSGDIVKYMNDHLEKTQIMILLCSPNFRKSEPCQSEWTAAFKTKKKIIPVFHNEDDIPPLLSSKVGVKIDFFDFESFFNNLTKEVVKRINLLPKTDILDDNSQPLIEKFKQILSLSSRIEISMVAKMLGMNEDEFLPVLLEFFKKLPDQFRIESREIISNEITKNLDQKFIEKEENEPYDSSKKENLQKSFSIITKKGHISIETEKKIIAFFINREKICTMFFLDEFNFKYYIGPYYSHSLIRSDVASKINNDILLLISNMFDIDYDLIEPGISELIDKNLLLMGEDSTSFSGKTHYPGFITDNQEEINKKSDFKTIIQFSDEFINKFLNRIVSLDDILEYYTWLYSFKLPRKELDLLIPDTKSKIERLGLRTILSSFYHEPHELNQYLIKSILFEGKRLVENRKQKITSKLSNLQKELINSISNQHIVVNKYMGTNYTERTLKKYREKMKEINVNYDEVMQENARKNNITKQEIEDCIENLKELHLVWIKKEGFSGYMDVFKDILDSIFNYNA